MADDDSKGPGLGEILLLVLGVVVAGIVAANAPPRPAQPALPPRDPDQGKKEDSLNPQNYVKEHVEQLLEELVRAEDEWRECRRKRRSEEAYRRQFPDRFMRVNNVPQKVIEKAPHDHGFFRCLFGCKPDFTEKVVLVPKTFAIEPDQWSTFYKVREGEARAKVLIACLLEELGDWGIAAENALDALQKYARMRETAERKTLVPVSVLTLPAAQPVDYYATQAEQFRGREATLIEQLKDHGREHHALVELRKKAVQDQDEPKLAIVDTRLAFVREDEIRIKAILRALGFEFAERGSREPEIVREMRRLEKEEETFAGAFSYSPDLVAKGKTFYERQRAGVLAEDEPDYEA